MAMPKQAITRYDLSAPVSEFDLRANRMGFIGPRVLRPRLVGLAAADVGKIPLKELLHRYSASTKRGPGSGYSRGDFEFDKYDYSTEEHGVEEPMSDATLALYRDMLDAENIHADRALDRLLGAYEYEVASTIYNTTTWNGAGLTTAITNEWDDHASATPIDDVMAAKEKVIAGCGLEPNALVLNSLQYDHLANCAQIVDRVKYTARADQQSMLAAVADVVGVEQIIVAGGLQNTANPQQTASVGRIWSGEYAMVCRVAVTDDPQEPCIGRTFIWTGDGPGSPGTDEELAAVVEEYREESVRGSVIRARNNRGIKIMYAAAGHLLSNVLTL